MIDLINYIRDIPDFPKPGINYKDITPLLKNAEAFSFATTEMCKPYRDQKIDYIVGVESRGFIFGSAMANELGVGIIPIRKAGKLPYDTHSVSYELEYGTDQMEIHIDALNEGDRIVLVDDVLATGGTMRGAIECVNRCGGNIIGGSVLIELLALEGASKLNNIPFSSLIEIE